MPTLHRVEDSFEVPDELPVIALRDLVFFPYLVLPLLIGRQDSLAALEASESTGGLILLVAQRDATEDRPSRANLHTVGTVARVLQTSLLPDGTSRVVLEGLGRMRVINLTDGPGGLRAHVSLLEQSRESDGLAIEDSAAEVRELYEEYVRGNPRLPDELLLTLSHVMDGVRLANLMAGHLLVGTDEKQRLLATPGVEGQLRAVKDLLHRELEVLRIEERLSREALDEADAGMFRLQDENSGHFPDLGDFDDELAELDRAIVDAELPDDARTRAVRELKRLTRLNAAAPEASVIRTYLEWILALPWHTQTVDTVDVDAAALVLDAEHYGLEQVRERILDHIAVMGLVGRLQGPILCLVGPPGVGKTSLGRSVARALNRKFVRVSLGGVRDEAEIRGHRRTYVGALPGRVIQGMRRSGSSNPVFLLDEVDKMARDFHGDPGAALLEVLDPEQNESFTDHYLELEFDLSNVLFIATANSLADIPAPLRDRMEVIQLSGYLDTEKRVIARRFLWPRQAARHGLDPDSVTWSDAALEEILGRYTREAGVRELEQRIARISRKLARAVATGSDAHSELNPAILREFLGPPAYSRTAREDATDRAGIANGLAWTASGGEVLDVEVAAVRGSGQIHMTGTLGEVMKESAFAAMTYARSRSALLGLDEDFHKKLDIHIHLPEGATPKDGPSAGITIAVALISALTGIPTRPDVAMTGEITLRGRVLPVGGLKEKAVAALREGVESVVVPALNSPDLELLPDEVAEGIRFLPVRTMDEVLEAALTSRPRSAPAVHPGADPGIALSQ